ncbi:MAG: UPF0280 family protein [Odoribacteraceae bacterium]|jgi:ApbE superfamily uncharacterized protein (UPF0280 family)|nr:UPF0280 family protein [Odoribacteraceae bacterium]
MEYKERVYRQRLDETRWFSFTVKYKETDLWIGVDHASWRVEILSRATALVRALRQEMDRHVAIDPGYATALTPYPAGEEAPGIFREMSAVALRSGLGPMSAVAGAVARQVGEALQREFGCREIIVENGGDIYAWIERPIDISIFAGPSPLSGRVGLAIPAGVSPLGICTSSGTVGPSLSFGKADAVTIVCRDCALADTYATAFGNRIRSEEEIDPCLEEIGQIPDILAAVCIKGAKMGIRGAFELKIWNNLES